MTAAPSTAQMIKSILTLITLASLAATIPAFAKTLKLPSDEFAIASITFPDNWEPEEVNNGVAGQSPDSAVYLAAVAVGSEKGMDAELDDTFSMLKEHKVELDKSTKKESKFKLNGEEVNELIYQGKDEDGPCSVSISFVPIEQKKSYWCLFLLGDDRKERKASRGSWENSAELEASVEGLTELPEPDDISPRGDTSS